MTLLSIIIPAYNSSRYIENCIKSIISNVNIIEDTFEIIIIDDGSNDDTSSIIHSIINRYPKSQIRYYFQLNKGASSARNNGIDRANGLFVWFIDSDDLIVDTAIYEINEVINNIDDSVDLIRLGKCTRGLLYEDDTVMQSHSISPNRETFIITDAFELLKPVYKNEHTVHLWRKDLLIQNKIIYPTTMIFNEDFHFVVNALLKANKAYINLSYNFYIVRENFDSIARSKWTYQKHEKLIQDQFTHIELLQTKINKSTIEDYKLLILKEYFDSYLDYVLFTRIRLKTPLVLIFNFFRKLNSMKLGSFNKKGFKRIILNHKITYFLVWFYFTLFKQDQRNN